MNIHAKINRVSQFSVSLFSYWIYVSLFSVSLSSVSLSSVSLFSRFPSILNPSSCMIHVHAVQQWYRQLRTQLQYNDFFGQNHFFIRLDSVFHFASNGRCWLLLFCLFLKLLTRTQVLYLSIVQLLWNSNALLFLQNTMQWNGLIVRTQLLNELMQC